MQRLSQSGSKLESRALGENPPVCSLYNDDDDDDGDDIYIMVKCLSVSKSHYFCIQRI